MSEVQNAPVAEETERNDHPVTQRRGAHGSSVLLEGKVAQVLNERQIVVNIGRRDGVAEGMRFAVLADTPLEIPDPVTGLSLGTLDQEKVKVQATQVLDKMTVCTTYETRVVGGIFFPDLSEAFSPRRRIPKTLSAEEEAYPAPLSSNDSYVKIGDRVRQIPALP